jgi:hypothetical protein
MNSSKNDHLINVRASGVSDGFVVLEKNENGLTDTLMKLSRERRRSQRDMLRHVEQAQQMLMMNNFYEQLDFDKENVKVDVVESVSSFEKEGNAGVKNCRSNRRQRMTSMSASTQGRDIAFFMSLEGEVKCDRKSKE